MAVTPADVAATLGRPAPADGSAEFVQWTMWIGDVRRKIKNRLGDLAALDQDTLDYVVRETIASRVEKSRASSTTVTVDDGTVTHRYETDSGAAALDDDWWGWAELTPKVDTDALSTRPGFAPDQDWGWRC